MAHIHTGPGEHDHTVTACIVRTDLDEPKVLLHMHRKLHKLLPVGGHIELHQNPWQAVASEVEQESGYRLSDLKILQPPHRITTLPDVNLHPYPVVLNTHRISDTHFHSGPAFAFITDHEPTRSVASGESTDLRWFSRSELDALTEDEVYMNTVVIYQFILDECLRHWDAVSASNFEL